VEFCRGCGAGRGGNNRFCLECGQAFPETIAKSDRAIKPARVLGWAGPLTLILFFLPWITVSCQMGNPSMSLSGMDLAKGVSVMGQTSPGQPILFLIPLAALVLLGLAIRAHTMMRAADRPAAIVQIVAAGVPLLIMLVKYISWASDIQQNGRGMITLSMNMGFVVTVLAFLCAAAGGILVLKEHGDAPAAGIPTTGQTASPEVPSVVFCPRCGARNSKRGSFCTECGQAFG